MNGQIEPQAKSLTATWQFAFFIGSVILLMFVLFNKSEIRTSVMKIPAFNLLRSHMIPPITAGGITVRNAIFEFSGKPISKIRPEVHGAVFMAFWIIFVAGPTAFIAIRHRILRLKMERKHLPFYHYILFGLICVWCISFPLLIAGTYYGMSAVLPVMKSDSALALYETEVMENLAEISFKARQYAFVPTANGGGGGRFTNGGSTVTLTDLGFKERTPLGRFILLPGKSDTTVRLLFFGNRVFPKGLEDKQESSDIVEFESVINPSFHTIRVQKQ